MSTTQLTVPPAYHFNENDFFNTQPVYLYNNALYKFMVDGVGNFQSGGGTSQFFIQKSTDSGVTWTDITPVSPQNFSNVRAQVFVRSGNRVYCSFVTTRTAPCPWKWFIFDLPTEAWVADSATVDQGTYANVDTNIGWGTAVRANGDIVVAWGGSSTTLDTTVAVYSPTSDTWANLGQVAGLSKAQICGGCIDSADRAHFIAVAWSGATFGQGTASIQHFVVKADNSITAVDGVYTFPAKPDPFFPWIDCGVPVAYLDVLPNTRKLAFPLGTRTNVAPFLGEMTGITLFIADEAEVPVWSQVVVNTGENFSQVTLDNSGVDAMAIVTLLPIEFPAQTQLHVFWTADGQQLFSIGQNWNNYMRHLYYADGAFSAITTEYSEVSERCMGAVYPIIVSQSGNNAVVGGHTSTIDIQLLFSGSQKYQSLALWWMSYAASGAGGNPLSIDCNDPSSAVVAQPYSHALTASGGTAPYSFAITAGGLPGGLSLSSAGVISGSPITFGVFSFTATVTDASMATASVTCTISVAQTAPFSVSLGGGMGCIPQCVGMCPPVDVDSLVHVNRGGDPAIVFAALAAIALIGGVE